MEEKSLKERIEDLFDETEAFYKRVYVDLKHVLKDVRDPNLRPEISDLVDVGYMCREIAKLFRDLGAEADARHIYIGNLLAGILMKMNQTSAEPGTRLRGTMADAFPDVQMRPARPQRGTEEYKALMKYFGAKDDVIESQLLDISYPRMVEHLTQLAHKGENVPDVLKQVPNWKTTFRRKRGGPKSKTIDRTDIHIGISDL